jgi:hypothetical protein
MGRVLFMACEYVPYALSLAVKFIVDMQYRRTGIAENRIDPVLNENFN